MVCRELKNNNVSFAEISNRDRDDYDDDKMVTRPLLVLFLRTYEFTAGSNTISEVHSFAFPTVTSIYLFTFDQVIAISPSHSTAEVPVWCVEATCYL